MYRIFKYTLDVDKIDETQSVEMPVLSKVLSVDFQDDGQLVCWAQVGDSCDEMHDRLFHIAFTGSALPGSIGAGFWEYIATLQKCGFVFHIYCK